MTRQEVEAIITPVDAGNFGPARAYCESREDGFGVLFAREGRRPEPVGPIFKTPREAIRLADLLNERLGGSDAKTV